MMSTTTTTRTAARPAVTLSVGLAQYSRTWLRHRLEVRSAVLGILCAGWFDSRREAMRAGRDYARSSGYRVIKGEG